MINILFMELNKAIIKRDPVNCLLLINVLLKSKIDNDDKLYLINLKKDIESSL